MKHKTLLESLPLTAEIIGRERHVRVIIGDTNTPCVDANHTIHLPPLDPDDNDTELKARGWLDHETGHIKHTDMDVFEKATRSSAARKRLLNIIEDVRIENLMSREYPGCRKNLDNIWSHTEEGQETLASPARAEWNPDSKIDAHIVQRSRARVIGQGLPKKTTAITEQVLAAEFTPLFVEGLNKLLDEIGGLQDTRQALDLAIRVEEYLKQAPPPKSGAQGESPEPQNGGSGGQSQSQGTGSESGPGDGSGDPSQSQAGESGSQDPAGKHDQSDGNRKAPGNSQSSGSSAGQGPPDASQKPNDNPRPYQYSGTSELKSADEASAESLAQASAEAQANGRAVSPGGGAGSEYPTEPLTGSAVNLPQVISATALLRSRMAGLLQAVTLKRRQASTRGRVLITRRLPKVPLGETRVFQAPTKLVKTDTLVSVLVDRSASMSGCIGIAMEAALGVSLALSEIRGVRAACYSFPANSRHSPVHTLMRMGESTRRYASRFLCSADGGTPMADALWYIARATALEPEPRKIVLVVTDGQPNYLNATQAVLEKMRHAGYETMGIGIRQHMGHLFKTHCTIKSVQELNTAMTQMLTKALYDYKSKAA